MRRVPLIKSAAAALAVMAGLSHARNPALPGFFDAVGGASSFTTLNPADKSAAITLSGGNLIATCNNCSASDTGVRATTGQSSGKFVYSATYGSTPAANDDSVGISNAAQTLQTCISGPTGCINYYPSGNIFNQAGSLICSCTGWAFANQVLYVAVDQTNHKVWFRPGGSGTQWDKSATDNPSTNTGGFTTSGLNATVLPVVGFTATTAGGGNTWTLNFNPTLDSTLTGFSGWPGP